MALSFSSSNVPISINNDSLGTKLTTYLDDNNLITKIDCTINGSLVDFLHLIVCKSKFIRTNHPDKFTSFNSSFDFYLVNSNNTKSVLAIGKISESEYKKIKFSLNGVVLDNIQDKLLENNVVCRISGNYKNYIRDDRIFYQTQDLNFLAVAQDKRTTEHVPNPNIGVIDS